MVEGFMMGDLRVEQIGTAITALHQAESLMLNHSLQVIAR
jgi:hypothetical protein